MNRFSPGARYMVASAFAFSAMTALVKHLGNRLPSQEIVLIRALVTLFLSLALLRSRGVNPWGVKRGLLVLRGVFGAVALSCVYYAVTHLPLAEATVLQYLNPVLTALLAAPLLKETLRKGVLVSCAVSLLGVVLVARPAGWLGERFAELFGALGASAAVRSEHVDTTAVLVALCGALCSACAYVVIRRLVATEHPNVIVLYFPLVAVPLSIPFVLTDLVVPQLYDWPALIGVGITAQVGQMWLTRGLRDETAGRATAISYLQVVFAALFGIAFFDEIPTAWTLAGGLLIFGSTLAVALRPRGAGPAGPSVAAT